MKSQKAILATGYPPARVRRDLCLSDINSLTVIAAQAGIQKNGKIRLFRIPSVLNFEKVQAAIKSYKPATCCLSGRINQAIFYIFPRYVNKIFVSNI